MKKGFAILLILAALASVQGCRRQQQAHSPAFEKLTVSGEGHFRGHRLGQTLSEISASETGILKVKDDWGLIYSLDIGDDLEASAEYYTNPQDSTHQLVSIISNISLPGEVEASALYRELQAWLDARYDIPDGGLGYFHWKDKSQNLEVILRLMDSKTAISLNFFRSADYNGGNV